MERYEYTTETLWGTSLKLLTKERYEEKIREVLNKYSRNGWRLSSVISIDERDGWSKLFIFERPYS